MAARVATESGVAAEAELTAAAGLREVVAAILATHQTASLEHVSQPPTAHYATDPYATDLVFQYLTKKKAVK